MDTDSKSSVRRPPPSHAPPSGCGYRLTLQPRHLGLHQPPQDDAWRMSPSLGSLALGRPAAGMSSTMAARRRRSWHDSLLRGCCVVTRRGTGAVSLAAVQIHALVWRCKSIIWQATQLTLNLPVSHISSTMQLLQSDVRVAVEGWRPSWRWGTRSQLVEPGQILVV
jgi:hypothetical protein